MGTAYLTEKKQERGREREEKEAEGWSNEPSGVCPTTWDACTAPHCSAVASSQSSRAKPPSSLPAFSQEQPDFCCIQLYLHIEKTKLILIRSKKSLFQTHLRGRKSLSSTILTTVRPICLSINGSCSSRYWRHYTGTTSAFPVSFKGFHPMNGTGLLVGKQMHSSCIYFYS